MGCGSPGKHCHEAGWMRVMAEHMVGMFIVTLFILHF